MVRIATRFHTSRDCISDLLLSLHLSELCVSNNPTFYLGRSSPGARTVCSTTVLQAQSATHVRFLLKDMEVN